MRELDIMGCSIGQYANKNGVHIIFRNEISFVSVLGNQVVY